MSIYGAPTNWWKLSQPSLATQRAVFKQLNTVAAPAAAKNPNKKVSDEVDVTTSSTPMLRDPKPLPDTDGPPACVLCKQKGHTANYLGRPRAPRRTPPVTKATLRQESASALSNTLSYVGVAEGARSVSPAIKFNQLIISIQLMLIISVIDTIQLAILTRKYRAAANPTEKLISLIKYDSLEEAIINSKF
ncbi:hypothetical protein EVAR_17787_1 [Eumeta japonica]|uniref:Uncharacterized protein n=1 Tax=Eumeta variegata TaxID=151549 RepID=A0A4C1TTS0_EUMVA|nr:hypothetical protein EVAR_17787_1 [Eumeta japonica]